MSVSYTPNLNLCVYDDGDNPGAGSKTIASTGLNGNAVKIDTAVGSEHNADGTHKDDKIGGSSLKAAIVDGSTLEASAATGAKTFRVKDAGITTAKIADSNVTTAKIADANVTTAKIADSNVTTAKIADANVTTAKIADTNVTAAKIATDAVTDAKIQRGNNAIRQVQSFAKASLAAGFLTKEGITMSNGQGMTLPHDFVITGLTFLDAAGVRESVDLGYDAGTNRIQSTECLSLYWTGTVLEIRRSGSAFDTFTPTTAPTTNFIVYITWEPYK